MTSTTTTYVKKTMNEIAEQDLSKAIASHQPVEDERDFPLEHKRGIYKFPSLVMPGHYDIDDQWRGVSYGLVDGYKKNTMLLIERDYRYEGQLDIIKEFDISSEEKCQQAIKEIVETYNALSLENIMAHHSFVIKEKRHSVSVYERFYEESIELLKAQNKEMQFYKNKDEQDLDFLDEIYFEEANDGTWQKEINKIESEANEKLVTLNKYKNELSSSLIEQYSFYKNMELDVTEKLKKDSNSIEISESLNNLKNNINLKLYGIADELVNHTNESTRKTLSSTPLNEKEIQADANKQKLLISMENYCNSFNTPGPLDKKTLSDIRKIDINSNELLIRVAGKFTRNKFKDNLIKYQSEYKKEVLNNLSDKHKEVKKYVLLFEAQKIAKKFAAKKIDKKLDILASKINSNSSLSNQIKKKLPKFYENINIRVKNKEHGREL